MDRRILIFGAVLLAVMIGILILLLCTEYREKVIDTNKKVIVQGGKNLNSKVKSDDILGEEWGKAITVIQDDTREIWRRFLCLTEQKSHRMYMGQFMDRKIMVGREEKGLEHYEKGKLFVKDPKVSYEHCCIYQERDYYLVKDCCSANHTWVNDQAVTTALPLKSGDRLRLANKTYEVRFMWSKLN